MGGPFKHIRQDRGITKPQIAATDSICRQESADNYLRVIVYLDERTRVIECRDGIQWIVQRRDKGTAERPWRGRHYSTTKKALIRLCGDENPALPANARAVLDALPENIGGRTA